MKPYAASSHFPEKRHLPPQDSGVHAHSPGAGADLTPSPPHPPQQSVDFDELITKGQLQCLGGKAVGIPRTKVPKAAGCLALLKCWLFRSSGHHRGHMVVHITLQVTKLVAYNGSSGPQVNSVHLSVLLYRWKQTEGMVLESAEPDLTVGQMPNHSWPHYANPLSEELRE